MKAPKPFNSLHQMVYWLSRVGDLSTTDFVSFGIFTSPEGSKKLTKNSPTNRKGWRRLEYLVGPSLSKKPIKHNDLSSFGEGWRSIERSEEHTSELQSLMRISYAVFCLKKNIKHNKK